MHRSQLLRIKEELGMASSHRINILGQDGHLKSEDEMVIEMLLRDIRDLQNEVKALKETVARLEDKAKQVG